jgi:hypothetical protein
MSGKIPLAWQRAAIRKRVKRLVVSIRGKSITRDHLDASITKLQKTGGLAKELPLSAKSPATVEKLERRS